MIILVGALFALIVPWSIAAIASEVTVLALEWINSGVHELVFGTDWLFTSVQHLVVDETVVTVFTDELAIVVPVGIPRASNAR